MNGALTAAGYSAPRAALTIGSAHTLLVRYDAPPPREQIGAGPRGQPVEEFGRHLDRLADMGLHGQIEVMGLRRAGLRAKSLKIRGYGGIADLGVTEPGEGGSVCLESKGRRRF